MPHQPRARGIPRARVRHPAGRPARPRAGARRGAARGRPRRRRRRPRPRARARRARRRAAHRPPDRDLRAVAGRARRSGCPDRKAVYAGRAPLDGSAAGRLCRFVDDVSVTTVRSPAEYEERLQRYLYERSEEGRAVRVGEKETSEQAAIVARYEDLFTREQLELLRGCEDEASDEDERERLFRLRKTCEAGLATMEIAEEDDELENRILAARVSWYGEELPLRTAQARLAVLDAYGEREELGKLQADRNADFNQDRLDLLAKWEALEAELSGVADPVERNQEEKQVSFHELERALAATSRAAGESYARLREAWFARLLGDERAETPSSYHSAYMRRLSPLESTYTKERSVEICMDTLKQLGFDLERAENIRLDLDDRPQKSPRACVIASDPPKVVHLITRAQGGLHDYQAFLHEAGHALHHPAWGPEVPDTFRRLSRDHGTTESYSYSVEAISREPGWHALHFGVSDQEARENAQATMFMN